MYILVIHKVIITSNESITTPGSASSKISWNNFKSNFELDESKSFMSSFIPIFFSIHFPIFALKYWYGSPVEQIYKINAFTSNFHMTKAMLYIQLWILRNKQFQLSKEIYKSRHSASTKGRKLPRILWIIYNAYRVK